MSLIQRNRPARNLILGEHYTYDVVEVVGEGILPIDLQYNRLLTLKLESIPIVIAGAEVGEREFYFCYCLQHSLLFVVETEMAKRSEERYYPQYGKNGNYNTVTDYQRIVWIYKPDNERARDPAVSKYLKPRYFPQEAI